MKIFKMRNKKHGVTCLLCALCATVALFGAMKLTVPQTQAAAYTLSEVTIPTDYTVGKTFTPPEASFTYQEKTYPATVAVEYPSGLARSAENYPLNEVGVYKIRYKAFADDGTLMEKTVEFTVSSDLYSVSSVASSAHYGTYTSPYASADGIIVSLAANDTFTYNKIIDLRNKTAEEGLVSFFAPPSGEGFLNSSIVVRFTDLYDENNYIETHLHAGATGSSYMLARHVGENWGGLYRTTKTDLSQAWKLVNLNNIQYRFYYGNDMRFGAMMHYSLGSHYGKPMSQYTNKGLTFSYDWKENALYANPSVNGIVADFDDDRLFSGLWKGFTTGEVILSIYGVDYAMSTTNVVITDVCGDDLQVNSYVGSPTPLIEVDTLEYEETALPHGIVGIPYKLYDSTVYTAFTAGANVTQTVYLNYHSNPVRVQVTDGYFTPTVAGTYTIEYAVTDSFGGKTGKTIDVEVRSTSSNQIGITLDDEGVATTNVFAKTTVKSASVVDASGNYELKAYAVSSTNKQVEIPVEGENAWSFYPFEKGEYTVTYEASDYIQTVKSEYKITVNGEKDIAILDDAKFASYYVKGALYDVESLNAYYLDNGETKEKVASIYTVDDCACVSGCTCARKPVEGNSFVVTATNKLSVLYVAEHNGVTAEKRYDLTVLDVGYKGGMMLNTSKYFQSDENVKFNMKSKRYESEVAPADGETRFEFIHPLNVWGYEFIFTTDENASYDSVEIQLVDTDDATKRLNIEIKAVGAKTEIVLNGRYSTIWDVAFAKRQFTVRYLQDTCTVNVISEGKEYKQRIVYGEGGEQYVGMPSMKANMAVILKNVVSAYNVKFDMINSHSFLMLSGDYIEPSVYYTALEQNKKYKIGDAFIVPRFYFADVVDVATEYYVRVLTPSGKPAVSVDGVTLDGTQDYNRTYEVIIDGYGEYYVEYEATDFTGNSTKTRYIPYQVVDEVPPTIELENAQVAYYLGETVKVASATVKDDMTEKTTLYVWVLAPDYSIIQLNPENSMEFTANVAGKYTVFYTAYDVQDKDGKEEEQNLAVKKYTITVVERKTGGNQ